MIPVKCRCGGEPEVHIMGHEMCDAQYYVCCENYDTRTWLFDSEEEAIEAWNKAMGVKGIKVPNKEIVIVEPFTTDMTHIGYCKCGYLVNEEWNYCPKCGREIQWGIHYE